jgi:hypothetical protein
MSKFLTSYTIRKITGSKQKQEIGHKKLQANYI